jgi:predicted dinucleotide-binding enzyme
MTIAIIGTGHIGSAVAQHLIENNHSVLLVNKTLKKADDLSKKLGEKAKAVTIEEAISTADTLILSIWFDDEKQFINKYKNQLSEKLIIDPSNPIEFDKDGNVKRTLPEGVSSGSIISGSLNNNTLYAKAFGTIGADDLAGKNSINGKKIVLYFATDTSEASEKVTKIINMAGFSALRVGSVEDSAIDIEVGGKLHTFGGLNGVVPTLDN